MIRPMVFAVVLGCLIEASVAEVTFGDASARLVDFAVRRSLPAGAPGPADIPFSSRWARPVSAGDPHDSFKAAKAFHATRFDWCYIRDPKFVRCAKELGYVVFGTINSELDGQQSRAGRDKDCNGKLIGNPELTFLTARGDIASEEYRRVALEHALRQLDAGVDGLQVDDPGMTYHNAIHLGGGYGDASLAAFRRVLGRRSTADKRKAWGISDDLDRFDYAAYVRERGETVPKPVRELFLEFHRQTLDEFYTYFRREIDAHAKRHVPLAGNNWSVQHQSGTPFVDHLDFWIGETSVQYGNPTAQRIYEKTRQAEKLGKLQIFSPMNDGLDRIPRRDEYVALCRRLIATSYACGTATLVPWDVWRRGVDTPRFFGEPAEFADLYGLVAEHAELFKEHEEVFALGPGIKPQFAGGLADEPFRLADSAKETFAAIRVVPRDRRASAVVHLVDWSSKPGAAAVQLRNVAFGWPPGSPMTAELVLPGATSQPVRGVSSEVGWTRFELPALSPYGVLVVKPAGNDGG